MAKEPEPAPQSPPWEGRKSTRARLRPGRLLAWLVLLALVGAIVYGLRPRPVEVELGRVTRGALTVHVTEEGRTRIRNRYVVASPVAGRMRRVLLKPGDEVRAGETVLTAVEPALPPLLDPRAKAEAEARVAMLESALERASQTLDVARTAERFARTNWDRIAAIRDQGGISATERDLAEREAQLRSGEVRAAEFAQRVAEFELAQAKASLLQITEPGSGTAVEVRSPVGGRVLRVMQESESVVAAGHPILEVGDPTDLEIEAEILSRDAVAIRPGSPATIEQWGGETPLAARVRRIEPAAFTKISALGVEEQRVFVLCDLIDPPPAARLLGDRFRVEVRVAVWHRDDVVLVPAGALFREGSAWKTFVFDGGRARKTEVSIGRSDGLSAEVLGGIAPGAPVLVHPPDVVVDGARVVGRH